VYAGLIFEMIHFRKDKIECQFDCFKDYILMGLASVAVGIQTSRRRGVSTSFVCSQLENRYVAMKGCVFQCEPSKT